MQHAPRPARGQTVLLVDNDPSFLRSCAKFLRLSGYEVRQARSLEDGRRALEGWVHLAILDMRLRNDEDEHDVSGLKLAQQSNPAVPKIILSISNDWQRVREALSTTEGEAPPAIYFVNKAEGLEVLLRHVELAFERHTGINWGLKIDWNVSDSYGLVRRVEPSAEGEHLAELSTELTDLIRRLFSGEKAVKVSQLLWQRKGRVALLVYTFDKERPRGAHVVVWGRRAAVLDERQRFLNHAPRAPGETATTLHATADTVRFAANAYSLAGAQPELVQPLAATYRAGPERFAAVLRILCEKTLGEWSQGVRVLEERRSHDELYRELLSLTADPASQAAFSAKVESLIRELPTLGVEVERGAGTLTFKFGKQSFTYPDPSGVIFGTFRRRPPFATMSTPGALAGDTVLTDEHRLAWVTDFARAGLAPPFWNHVELEAAIRFDWGEAASLHLLHDLEQSLTSSSFTRLNPSEVELPLRKQLRSIQHVRLLADKSVGEDPQTYHLALLFHAAERLTQIELPPRHMPNELLRPAHWLLAAATLCRRLEAGVESRAAPVGGATRGLTFDQTTNTAWVNGEEVKLTDQNARILGYLYDRPNQICTPGEIIQHALQINYDPLNDSQVDLLNVAMHRLRAALEEDPEHPVFVRRVRRKGFRLTRNPEEEEEQNKTA